MSETIILDHHEPCGQCGQPTDRLVIVWEAVLCSPACEAAWEDGYWRSVAQMGGGSDPLEPDTADDLWNEVAPQLRKQLGIGPLTPEEAQRAYDQAEPVPISSERIQEIVDFATGRKLS